MQCIQLLCIFLLLTFCSSFLQVILANGDNNLKERLGEDGAEDNEDMRDAMCE